MKKLSWLDKAIDEEFRKIDLKIMENVKEKDVVSFEYTNSNNDLFPIVLVTKNDENHIEGYNLNYYEQEEDLGSCYRRYSKKYIKNIVNLSNYSNEKPLGIIKKIRVKDLEPGVRARYIDFPEVEVIKMKDRDNVMLIKAGDPYESEDVGMILSNDSEVEVEIII